MLSIRAFSALLLATALMLATEAQARLVKLEIAKREVVADGMPFGATGPYEKLTGRAWFEVDPALERNKTVFDIDCAQLKPKGRVEFLADMVILKPADMALGAKTLFFEVNDRGRRISFGRMQDTASEANMYDPMALRDFGNGFLMKHGYVIAWAGWGADIAPSDNRSTVNFPIALENGQPVTEGILTEFSDRNFNGGKRSSLPLSGGAVFKSFPAVSADKKQAQVDAIGNDVAGIRHPFVKVPVATLLGWNTRTKDFGGPHLCDLLGSTIALPKSRADAQAKGDPRPSLEELYAWHEAYVAKVAEAATRLQAQCLMLPKEDVNMIVREAGASAVVR